MTQRLTTPNLRRAGQKLELKMRLENEGEINIKIKPAPTKRTLYALARGGDDDVNDDRPKKSRNFS